LRTIFSSNNFQTRSVLFCFVSGIWADESTKHVVNQLPPAAILLLVFLPRTTEATVV